MKQYLQLEIMTEVALQLGDTNDRIPRAEARWRLVEVALDLINSGMIDEDSEDLDEIVADFLQQADYK